MANGATSGGKGSKSEFWTLLITGLICAVAGAALTHLAERHLIKLQRIDHAKEEKLKELVTSLRGLADARDTAFVHSTDSAKFSHDKDVPDVDQFIKKADLFCSQYEHEDWNSYPLLDPRFQTEFKGLFFSVCHSRDFLISQENIRCNAYQFADSVFLRDEANYVEGLITKF